MSELVKHIYFAQKNRSYDCSIHPLDRLPEAPMGELIDFYRIWKKSCNGQLMPRLKDMNFERLRGWHSNIRVAEYGDDIYAPKKIKIMGETFERYWGKETTYDRIASKTISNEDTAEKYYEYLKCIYDYNYCLGQATLYAENGLTHEIRWIDLPLSDDGKNVT